IFDHQQRLDGVVPNAYARHLQRFGQDRDGRRSQVDKLAHRPKLLIAFEERQQGFRPLDFLRRERLILRGDRRVRHLLRLAGQLKGTLAPPDFAPRSPLRPRSARAEPESEYSNAHEPKSNVPSHACKPPMPAVVPATIEQPRRVLLILPSHFPAPQPASLS